MTKSYITEPGQTTQTTTQKADLSRTVRLNTDDNDVVFGQVFDGQGNVTQAWTTGNWAKVVIPSHPGYTVNITQTVTNADGTTTVTHPTSIGAVTVDGSTLSTTIDVTYSATSTATLSGSASSTYNGSPITWNDVNSTADGNNITVTVTGPDTSTSGTYTLVQGDVEFSSDGTNWSTTLPTNAGTYQIRLTDQAKTNIKNKFGNNSITWGTDDANISGSATYTINKANITVSGNSSQTAYYDGTAFGKDANGDVTGLDLSKFVPTLSAGTSDSPITTPTIPADTLNADDFTIENQDGTENATPTAAGTYKVYLNTDGIAKLQKLTGASNFNWPTEAVQVGTFTINPVSTTATISSATGRTYDGVATTNSDLNAVASINIPGTGTISYTLVTGDYTWNTTDNAAPINASDTAYTITLTTAGIHNLQKAINDKIGADNVTIASTDVTNNVSYKISKATPTVVFNGVGSKTYGQNDTNWSTPTGLTITAPGTTNASIELGNGDYQFVLNSDHSVTSTTIPTNVGEYMIELTEQGKNKIKNATASTGSNLNVDNLDWTKANISGTGTFTVNAAEAKAELSGTNNRDYNGSAVTTTDINNGGSIAVTISIPNSTKTIKYTLQDDDYTWVDGTDPTNQGSYTLELNKTNILAHLQDEIANDSDWNGNVTLANTDLSGTATFTINAKAANVSLSGNNGNGVTYSGSAVSTPLDALKNALSASGTINNAKFDLTGLTTAGFDWYDAAGTTKLDSAPTDHGTYTIKLNETGLQQIQDKNTNYSISIVSPNAYTFKINTAKGSVALSGERTITFGTDDSASYFNGYTATLTAPVNGFTPSFTLQAGELQFSSDNGQTWTTTVPTAVGTYQVKLSDAARNRIVQDNSANGNIDWPGTNFSGVKTYIITPYQSTASLSGSATKPYNGSAVTIDDINNAGSTIGVTINLPNGGTTTYKLVAGDYTWNTTDGAAPTDAGTYQLSFNLTDQGKTNLQNWLNQTDVAGTGLNGKPNVLVPTEVTGTASFEITSVAITVTQSGSGDKIYDGNAASVSITDLTNSNNWSASGMISGQSFNIPSGLALTDFDWYQVNSDGTETKLTEAPTNAGSYALKLNNYGLQKLQNANKNYSFSSVGGQYGYTINPTAITISGTGSQTANYDGTAFGKDATGDVTGLDLSQFKPSISAGTGVTGLPDISDVTFDSSDYTIENLDGTVNNTPTTAGTYNVYLNGNGITKLKALDTNGNFTWPITLVKVGTFTINPVSTTATVTGSTGKVYDDKAVTSSDLNAVVSIAVPGLSTPITYTLVDGDYTWSSTPTNVGTYTITLTTDGISHLQAAINDKIGSGNVTIANSGITNKVSYQITQATATVGFADNEQDVVYNGRTGQFDPTTYFKPNVTVTTGSPAIDVSGTQLSVVDGDFIFTKDGQSQTTEPTDLGTYTVTLSDAGLAKLQQGKDTTNYNWVNSATGTYKIDQAQGIKVTLKGGQSETYKGMAYVNDNIVPGDYSVTLANGQTYTLVAGDLEFVAGQDPTNVDTYQVQLSDQGKRNIEAVDSTHYTYDFSNAGTGTFTIKQAVPTATVSGSASKTYDGSAIANYQPAVSITAPGNNTVSLEAGTDYVWVKDGQTYNSAPSDAGSYTIQLTTVGETKIKGVNAQSLDWSNVTIGNTTSYVINKRAITVTEEGSQDATYDGTSYGDASGLDASKFVPTLTTTDGVAVPDISGISWDPATDFVIKDAAGNTMTADQIKNAGTYHVYLTNAGLSKLTGVAGAANFDWPASVTSAGTFTIKAAEAFAAISGSNSKTYDGDAVTTTQLNSNGQIKVTITVPGLDHTLSYTLQDGDYTWNNGTPVNASSTSYTFTLTSAGIGHLQDAINAAVGNGNVDIAATDITNTASFTINKAAAKYELTGGQSRPYDGTKAVISAGNGNYTLTYTVNGQSQTVTLTDADLAFATPSAEHINKGSYDIVLSQTGLAKLQRINANYDWNNFTDSTSTAKFVISAQEMNVNVVGSASDIYNGADQAISQDKLDNANNGWGLVWGGNTVVPGGITTISLTPDDLE